MKPNSIARKHRIRLVANFRSVLGPQLLHDVSDMHLNGAIPQFEFKGNDLVCLSLSECKQDGLFAELSDSSPRKLRVPGHSRIRAAWP
jgi:hypothetical protein